MIEKIISIQDVGQFTSLASAGTANFRKLTLLFGRNGHGKSTIADVLRMATTHGRLSSRRRLGATALPAVHIRHGGTNLKKANGTWTGPKLLGDVFDREFIDRNVHLAGEVAAEQRQNLLQLALGEAEVAAARAVDALTTKISDVTSQRAALFKQLEPLAAASGLGVDDFLKLVAPTDPIAALADLEKAIANAKQAQPIRDRALFSLLPLLPPPDWAALESVLAVTVESLSATAKQRVSDHIQQRLGDEKARTWIQEGQRYQANEVDCPFCGQDTSNSELVAAYSQYFSDAFERHLTGLRKALELAVTRARSWQTIEATNVGNDKSLDFWKAALQQEPVSFDLNTRAKWTAAMSAAESLLTRKLADPMTPISAHEAIAAAEADTEAVLASIKAHNAALTTYNELIAKLKSSVASVPIATLEARKKTVTASVQRHQPKNISIANEIAIRDAEKKTLEAAKIAARKQLDAAKLQRLASFESEVNAQLQHIGAGFRIESFESKMPGGKPSAEYGIRIGGEAISATARSSDAPSFRTVLSDGDKSSLALAMFVAAAKRAPDLNQRALIFDDPMTSLDEDRSHATQEIINELTEAAGQVVVLSHQPRFLLGIGRDLPAGDVQGLKLDGAGQSLEVCNLRQECRSDYERRMAELRDFARSRKTLSESGVRSTIRVVLEEYLRVRFPHLWTDNMWLGDFIKAAEAESAVKSEIKLAELRNLSRFSSPEHHATNSPQYSAATPAEIRNYAERTYIFIASTIPV